MVGPSSTAGWFFSIVEAKSGSTIRWAGARVTEEGTLEIEIALCLPREAETVGIVRDVAVLSLMRLGVTEACAEDIRIALSEACTNVVDHSEADDQYEVRLQVDGRRCEVRVIDTGRGFDVMSLSAVPVAADSPRGRGISLMHALVDSINFTSQPEEGTIVHLGKTLDLVPGTPLDRLAPPAET
jgi:serine/threonine-protein kinase RsbW